MQPTREVFGNISFPEQLLFYLLMAGSLGWMAWSFRERARMERILSQLRAAEAVDEKYGSLEPLLERMRARVRAVDAPDGTKEEFLKGFTSSANEGLARRTELTAKEKAWVQASIDLYESAMAAKPSYYIRNGKLIFQSAEAVAEFDGKMKKAQDLRGEFLSANEAFEKTKREGFSKLKLQPSDLGVPDEAPAKDKDK